jgi:murein DD-endopeptidase MepM/ murein hydrolase activator NlpD
VRYFPSASRRRIAAATAAAALTLSAVAIPFAHAKDDDLEDRQDHVQKQIRMAQGELEHASKQAQRAGARLGYRQAKLTTAKTELGDVRRQLAAARVRDAQTRERLAVAEARLETARAELQAGREAVALQRDRVTDSIVGIYEQGDPGLLAFTALVNADSLEDLTTRSAAEEAIVSSETDMYADLTAAEERLAAQEQEVENAKTAAEAQRRAAAVNLASTQSLVERSRQATDRVRGLVESSRRARQQAIAARARDAAVLRQLKEREERIKQLILAAARQESNTFSGATNGFLNFPVNGSVTSPYGYRKHPIYGYWGLHDGTDFGAGCGQALFAGAQGTVVETYYDAVYGNRLYLNVGRVNGANLTLVYNHLSGYQVGEGSRVDRGDVVGYVGSTGWSTGCHLHFTVLRNGEPVNPETYF